MDSDRFDRLTRIVSQTRSRRQVLRGLAGGVSAAAVGGSVAARPVAAAADLRGCCNRACATENREWFGGQRECASYCEEACPRRFECGDFCLSCFTGETRIAMADGTSRPIEQVAIGDRVLGREGVNRVVAIERPRLGTRRLYALNDGPFFVTAEHPFLTEDGWKAVDPAATAAENPALVVGRLNVGDYLLTLAGVAVLAAAGGGEAEVAPRLVAVPLGSLIGMASDPATPLYNLRLDGDHAYFADELLVHNK
jgi:hypothetical protein